MSEQRHRFSGDDRAAGRSGRAALLLVLLSGYRLGARLNVGAALLTLLAAVTCLGCDRTPISTCGWTISTSI
jgi:hypothetical protein